MMVLLEKKGGQRQCPKFKLFWLSRPVRVRIGEFRKEVKNMLLPIARNASTSLWCTHTLYLIFNTCIYESYLDSRVPYM